MMVAIAGTNGRRHADSHTYSQPDANGNRDSYPDSNSYSDGYIYAYAYSYRNIHADSDAHINFNAHALHRPVRVRSDRRQHRPRHDR